MIRAGGLAFVGCLLATALASAAEPVIYARFMIDGETKVGEVRGNRVLELDGKVFGAHKPSDRAHDLADIKLLAPVTPGNVFAVGLNYLSHAGLSGAGQPEIFYKSPTSVTGTGAAIPYPAGASSLHYEGELVVVIGKAGRFIPLERAMDHVFGVTAGYDVSE